MNKSRDVTNKQLGIPALFDPCHFLVLYLLSRLNLKSSQREIHYWRNLIGRIWFWGEGSRWARLPSRTWSWSPGFGLWKLKRNMFILDLSPCFSPFFKKFTSYHATFWSEVPKCQTWIKGMRSLLFCPLANHGFLAPVPQHTSLSPNWLKGELAGKSCEMERKTHIIFSEVKFPLNQSTLPLLSPSIRFPVDIPILPCCFRERSPAGQWRVWPLRERRSIWRLAKPWKGI